MTEIEVTNERAFLEGIAHTRELRLEIVGHSKERLQKDPQADRFIRELMGEEYCRMVVRYYDEARYFLKNAGKPNNSYDVWLIEQAKLTCALSTRYK